MTPRQGTGTLFERDAEQAALLAGWDRACRGHGSTWFVCAEGGGGKSRLLREVTAHVGAERVLHGAAEPVAPPEPYLAFTRALPGFQPGATHALSAARMVEILTNRSEGKPIAVILDDLHYADEGTAALLVRLATEAAGQPWLVIAAFRPGEGVPGLTHSTIELVAQGLANRLDLHALSADGVAALVEEIRGEQLSADEAASITFDSGGNPWFVEALARGSGAMSAARDRIQVRLGRLERELPGSFRVLSSLAAITRPTPFEIVAPLCGGDSPGLRELLRSLRDSRVLEEVDDGWQFRQELMRRAVLESMIAADRRDAHRALAEALEPTGHAPEMAMHYAAAGDQRAAPWALRAAREAAALDAHTEAFGQLRRCLSFDLEPAVRQEALGFAAYEALVLSQPQDAMRLGAEGIAIGGGAPGIRAHLHIAAAAGAWELGRVDECWTHLGHAIAESGEVIATRAAASTAVQELMIAVSNNDYARLESSLRRVRATSEGSFGRSGFHHALQASADVFEALALADRGDCKPSRARLAVKRLEAIGADAPQMASSVQVVAQLIYCYRKAVLGGFVEEAAELFSELERLIERRGTAWHSRIAPYRALELVQSGRFAPLPPSEVTPAAGSDSDAVARLAAVRRECRAAGSVARAEALLREAGSYGGFAGMAAQALAHLDIALARGDGDGLASAQRLYQMADEHQHGRFAGEAAVAMVRLGGQAPNQPSWLGAQNGLEAWWRWARCLAGPDRSGLPKVAAELGEMGLPYEAAMAIEDAGDLATAYRGFRDLGAVTARERLSRQLRSEHHPVPRRTRASLDRDGLTDAEREICRLVAESVRNAEIADRLTVSVRTVETHLSNIYRKAEVRGRVALANWWRERAAP
jgi:DNA-binding CsgD family transcriptional regulator